MNLFFGRGQALPITRPTDVRDYLPDDKKHHYRDGYSMAEAAKCWVAAGGHLPRSIADMVGTNELIAGHFEYDTVVWGRGTAMTDVMAFVPNGVVAVEAKVNEPFDELVSHWVDRNKERNPNSPPYRRDVIQQYAEAFGVGVEHLLDIRYQLLQRTLCAALTAREIGAPQAWMIVQSFAPLDGDGRETNHGDFERYLALVGGAPVVEGVRVQLAWAQETCRPLSDNINAPESPTRGGEP